MSRDDPAAWLLSNADLIPSGAAVLDVACGRGRNALFLAMRGCRVHAVDRDATALDHLRSTAADSGLAVTIECRDLETVTVSFGKEQYDAVIVFNYLHRPLMPEIVRAVRTGGVLIYETFTSRQAERGRPQNPAFLLNPGELTKLVAPLHVIRSREGEYDGKFVASVVAVR